MANAGFTHALEKTDHKTVHEETSMIPTQHGWLRLQQMLAQRDKACDMILVVYTTGAILAFTLLAMGLLAWAVTLFLPSLDRLHNIGWMVWTGMVLGGICTTSIAIRLRADLWWSVACMTLEREETLYAQLCTSLLHSFDRVRFAVMDNDPSSRASTTLILHPYQQHTISMAATLDAMTIASLHGPTHDACKKAIHDGLWWQHLQRTLPPRQATIALIVLLLAPSAPLVIHAKPITAHDILRRKATGASGLASTTQRPNPLCA